MAPKKTPKAKWRASGAAQASGPPTTASSFSQGLALQPGQGVNWQRPTTTRSLTAKGNATGAARGHGRGTRRSASAQNHNAAVAKREHERFAIPELLASHRITLRLPSHLLEQFPSTVHSRFQKASARGPSSPSEPFVTLKTCPIASVSSHSRRDPPKALTLHATSTALETLDESPLPSLISASADTSTSDIFPETPVDNQPLVQPAVTSELSASGVDDFFRRSLSPKKQNISQQSPRISEVESGRSPRKSLVVSLPLPAQTSLPTTMAPVKDNTGVQAGIKDVIQNLYEIQSQTHGYVPDTADLLVDKMTDLAQSLSRLQNMTSTVASPNNPIHQARIAPEIVDYVDDGRNPDIFTRDFVENVQRGNAVINGKQKAFKDFSEVFAQVLKEGLPGVSRHVDQVMDNAGFTAEEGSDGNKATSIDGPQNGRNGG